MADTVYVIKESTLKSIGDVIRAKTGKTDAILVSEIASEIGIIPDSPQPPELSTDEEMSMTLVEGQVGDVYKFVGTTGTYKNGVLYELVGYLTPPTISITDTALTISTNDSDTQSFDLYIDGVYNRNVTASTTTTFDLSTLELAEGTYEIYVIAKADGYPDSDISNIVSYEAAAEFDVNDLISGWTLNNTTLDFSMIPSNKFISGFNINGKIGDDDGNIVDVTFNAIGLSSEYFAMGVVDNSYGYRLSNNQIRLVYNGEVQYSGSMIEKLQPLLTFTIIELPSNQDDNLTILLAFLQANATKQ